MLYLQPNITLFFTKSGTDIMNYRPHQPHTFKSATRPLPRFKLHTGHVSLPCATIEKSTLLFFMLFTAYNLHLWFQESHLVDPTQEQENRIKLKLNTIWHHSIHN